MMENDYLFRKMEKKTRHILNPVASDPKEWTNLTIPRRNRGERDSGPDEHEKEPLKDVSRGPDPFASTEMLCENIYSKFRAGYHF